MMKKNLVVLLMILVLCLCAASPVFADASGTDGGVLTWTLDDAGRMQIDGNGAMTDGTFWENIIEATAIREVAVSEGVTRIGEKAFFNCVNLSAVTLPESVTAIGESAFEGCTKLTEMTLPSGITDITGTSFSETTETFYLPRLKTVTGVTLGSWDIPFRIPGDPQKYIFAHTETSEYIGLTIYEPSSPDAEFVNFPEGVECIRPGFFENMTHVKRVRLPKSIKKLTIGGFAGVYRDFVIECAPGSYAESFALAQGLQYDNGVRQVIGYQITDANRKVKWIVKNYIRAGMSEKQKALVLHNWLINNSHYDESLEVHESDTILTEGYGVCEAYAFAYFRLLKEAGMAVATFTGDSVPATNQGHEWNLVRVGGTWYHVDCTWDDPKTGPKDYPCISGMENRRYFLLKDRQISADHSWDRHYSADRGRMFSYYDPEMRMVITQQSWDSDCHYLLDWKNRTATVIDVALDAVDSVTIPSTFYLETRKFKVTGIEAGAFMNNKRIKSVSIGKNIEMIGKNAFRNCTKLKKIHILTKQLTLKTVGANAFAGIPGKAVISCPKKYLTEYRKILRKRGVPKTAVFQ